MNSVIKFYIIFDINNSRPVHQEAMLSKYIPVVALVIKTKHLK